MARRGDYGYDAPYALVLFALLAFASAIVAGVMLSAHESRQAILFALYTLFFLGHAVSFFYTTRHGKLQVWDEILDDLRLQGNERVLDMGCGRGAVLTAVAARLTSGRAIGIDLWSTRDQSGNAGGVTRRNALLEDVADRVAIATGDMRSLPLRDAAFDLVCCQFGAMFFPDRSFAYREAKRVLRPGGHFLFNVWDRIEENEFAQTVTDALVEVFPEDPPRFMAQLPHGYHDTATLRRDLSAGGFSAVPEILTLPARSRAASAHIPAVAYCQGTPLRGEIEARDPAKLLTATAAAEAALEQRFGTAAVDGRIQAHVVSVEC